MKYICIYIVGLESHARSVDAQYWIKKFALIRHFADNTFKGIFLRLDCNITIRFVLFHGVHLIICQNWLATIMVWYLSGNGPLPYPILTKICIYIYVYIYIYIYIFIYKYGLTRLQQITKTSIENTYNIWLRAAYTISVNAQFYGKWHSLTATDISAKRVPLNFLINFSATYYQKDTARLKLST